MAVVFHPLLQNDLRAVLAYYEAEAGPALADRFFADLEITIDLIASTPARFHEVAPGLKRANLSTFPYHLLFRLTSTGPRILVLRHHARHPALGARRR